MILHSVPQFWEEPLEWRRSQNLVMHWAKSDIRATQGLGIIRRWNQPLLNFWDKTSRHISQWSGRKTSLMFSSKVVYGLLWPLHSLDCLFTNTPYLEVGFQGEVLNPGGKAEIPFSFYPREAISYHEAVTFEINGLLQRIVEVLGKGIEMKVRLYERPRTSGSKNLFLW